MQVTIARQLGLDPSTVSNFFMNARRRSVDKWKDDSIMDDDHQDDNLLDGMSDDEDDMMSSSDEMSQHANNHHFHMQQDQPSGGTTVRLARYPDGTVKAMPIHLGAGSVLVATSATHPAAVVQHLQHPGEALTPTSLDL
jgi:hypothetical protein